jgi:hypothetical protein
MQKQALTHHSIITSVCVCAKSEKKEIARRRLAAGACLRASVAFLPMRGDTVVVSAVAAAGRESPQEESHFWQ